MNTPKQNQTMVCATFRRKTKTLSKFFFNLNLCDVWDNKKQSAVKKILFYLQRLRRTSNLEFILTAPLPPL